MLTLTIGAYTVRMHAASGSMDYEDQVFRGQRFDGSLSVVERAASSTARTLRVDTPVDQEDVDLLEALLNGAEFVTASGSVWEDASVECAVSEVERSPGPRTGQVSLSFSLTERLGGGA